MRGVQRGFREIGVVVAAGIAVWLAMFLRPSDRKAPPAETPPAGSEWPSSSMETDPPAPASGVAPPEVGMADASGPSPSPPARLSPSPPRVEALLSEDGARLVKPPFADAEGTPPTPSPYDRRIAELASEIATASGPEAATHARNLIRSDQEGVGMVGAALLAEQPAWALDDALYDAMANHADMAVPLFALQALRDAGRDAEADALEARLLKRMEAEPDGLALVQGRTLPGTALRALVALSRTLADAGQRADLMSAVVASETADYGARMRALLELREVLSFEDFRARVREEAQHAATGEPDVWRMGVERLAARLDGPVEVHTGPEVLAVSDIQVMMAQPYPAQYEDLALHLERLLRGGNALFGAGVQAALAEWIGNAASHPVSEDEMRAVRRIETLAGQIEETDITALVPPPPPGR